MTTAHGLLAMTVRSLALTGRSVKLLLALASAVILGSESRGTQHVLPSQNRDSPNLEGQDLVFISPRNTVTQSYPQALGSLFVASHDSQGYGGGIRSHLRAEVGGRKEVEVKVRVTL
jgi:hypothetical protein